MNALYEQGKYFHLASPLLLALRALIQKGPEIHQEFTSQANNLELVLEIAIRSQGHNSLKNIHVSTIILICECGYDKFESLINTRLA